MDKPAILIVEDEEIVARDLANKLRKFGYVIVATTSSGEGALEIARERHPDLILMDIRLPGTMDGVETAAAIRRELEVPILYLTAHSDSATLQRAKLTEPYGYILKPFTDRELQAFIEIALYKHRAERKLRENERRLILALSAGKFGTWDWNMVTNGLVWSDDVYGMLGHKVNAVQPSFEAWLKSVHPEDRAAAETIVARARERGGDVFGEGRVQWPDGSVRWVEIRGRMEHDSNGKPVRCYGVIGDITERRRVLEALKEAQEKLTRHAETLEKTVEERTAKLRELVGELEHFSYTITHDMRAPLRGMQGYTEMMVEACAGCQNQDSQGFLRRIRTSGDRMDALITDALSFSKVVRQELPLEPVDPGALLRGMLDSYPEFQPSKADIRIQGELPLVMGNEAGLTQCFSNLIGNAVKFVKPGQRPEVEIRAERRDGLVRIWVEDQGIGIPEIFRGRVFDMFMRGHEGYEGTGIGLALVQKVVQRMGGRVGVESQEGCGSRFWLELKPGEVRMGR